MRLSRPLVASSPLVEGQHRAQGGVSLTNSSSIPPHLRYMTLYSSMMVASSPLSYRDSTVLRTVSLSLTPTVSHLT